MTNNRKKALLKYTGFLMIAGGLFLLLYFFSWKKDFPYTYELVKTGSADKFTELPGLNFHGTETPLINQYELKVSGMDKPLAVFYTAERKDMPPVILDYQSKSTVPILMLPVDNETHSKLYSEIRENTDDDAVFLSWWDHSLRISLFTGRNVIPGKFIGRPVFIPDEWKKYRDSIIRYEKKFWKQNSSPEAEEEFRTFVDAMLSNEEEGKDILKKLAGDKKPYVIVDQKDILKLSENAGERFQIGIKDFSFSGDYHGINSRVKKWLEENGFKYYMVEEAGENIIRLYYLTREEDKDRLMVKLLPFTSSNPFKLEHFKIKYQNSTLWVYELI